MVGVLPDGFYALNTTFIFGLPITGYYLLAITVVMWIVLEYTPVGRYLYAIGANQRAAQLNGIPTRKYVIGAFMAWMGFAVLLGGPTNTTEWIIAGGALGSGGLLLFSAWSTWQKGKARATAEAQENRRLQNPAQVSSTASDTGSPELLATWYYPKEQWNAILGKLVEKSRKEEWYTVIWFPIIFVVGGLGVVVGAWRR